MRARSRKKSSLRDCYEYNRNYANEKPVISNAIHAKQGITNKQFNTSKSIHALLTPANRLEATIPGYIKTHSLITSIYIEVGKLNGLYNKRIIVNIKKSGSNAKK